MFVGGHVSYRHRVSFSTLARLNPPPLRTRCHCSTDFRIHKSPVGIAIRNERVAQQFLGDRSIPRARGKAFLVQEVIRHRRESDVVRYRRRCSCISELEVERKVTISTGRSLGAAAAVSHLEHGGQCLHISPRTSSGPHFEHDASETPDINFGGVTLSLDRMDHLRCHPEHGALEIGRDDRVVCVVFNQPRSAIAIVWKVDTWDSLVLLLIPKSEILHVPL